MSDRSGLEVRDLAVSLPGSPVIRAPYLRVAAGEAVAAVGAGGSGKSLLAAGLAGFAPAVGSIEVCGVELAGRQAHDRTRAGLALVTANASLVPGLTVRNHIELVRRGRRPAQPRRWSRRSLLAALPGLDRVLDAELGEIGAWERLATGLAAALRTEPDIVVLDEPVSGLAGAGGGLDRLRAALFRMTGAGIGVLLLTRDPVAATSLTHRSVLFAGRIVGEP